MASDKHQELFDHLYDEVSDRYYELDEEPNSEALQITYHLGQILQCAEYELIPEWIKDGTYDVAKAVLIPALTKGIAEGIPQLEHVTKLFSDIDWQLSLPVYCDVCGGSGEIDYGLAVSGYGGEPCTECLGSGMVDGREGKLDPEPFHQLGYEFNQSASEQTKSAFGELALLYIPKNEHDALFTAIKLKTMFRK